MSKNSIIYIIVAPSILFVSSLIFVLTMVLDSNSPTSTSNSVSEVINISPSENNNQPGDTLPEIEDKKTAKYVEPIAEFSTRIIKKPFNIYIDRQNSPIPNERFSGYHTGVDIEYEDTNNEVSVVAIADGKVIRANWTSGYGGLLVIKHSADEVFLSLYGHLDPDALPTVGQKIVKGQKIASLGKGGTSETDNERQHLHFAIIKGSNIDVRGYVQSKNELSKWHDPVEFLKQ